MPNQRLLSLLCCGLLLLAIAACSDDDGPACPDATVAPTMANIWPHADGNTWTYDETYTSYRDTTAELVAPGETVLPTMDALYAELVQPLDHPAAETLAGSYSLRFAGEFVTAAGDSVQNLTANFQLDRVGSQAPLETDPMKWADVRSRADKASFAPIISPLLLRGYAFAYEDSGYYGYSDYRPGHIWVFLAGDLYPGTEFVHVLASNPDGDVVLYGRILGRRKLTIGETSYCNVVECQYVVDMGESQVTDAAGNPRGAFRSYIHGVILYAPGIGPVKSLERVRAYVRSAYNPAGDFDYADHILELAEVVLGN